MARARPDHRVVTDTIHGTLRLEGVTRALLDTPQVQRLSGIHQTGLSYLVFPGANHTRLEHSLGASHIAGQMARALQLSPQEETLAVAATLLHDIGHGAFSHTLEFLMAQGGIANHMQVTKDIILGRYDPLPPGHGGEAEGPSVSEVLRAHDLDPAEVASLISGDLLHDQPTLEDFGSVDIHERDETDPPDRGMRLRLLAHLVHSPIDADQIDYLLRDSHYTGVAHGVIDKERLVSTLLSAGDRVVVHRNGLPAVEGMIMARALMYSSVYFHKTVRIAEVMLCRAVAALPTMPPVHRLNDADLWQLLLTAQGLPQRLALSLRYRRLYKRVLAVTRAELGSDGLQRLEAMRDPQRRAAMEAELADRAGVGPGEVFIDTPHLEWVVDTPRTQQVQVGIFDPDQQVTVPLSKLSAVAKVLSAREVPEWSLMVAAHPRAAAAVRTVAAKVLWG